jgi:RNA polymerase sigma factor (sigma-70 family)
MNNQTILDDSLLVRSYMKGDESAFETLLIRHKERVFSYIMMTMRDTQLAEDIFQDTFIKVVRTLKSGKYNEEGKFLPWVMRIAHNLMIDYFRKNKRMPTTNENDEYDIFGTIKNDELNFEEQISKKQLKSDLRELIRELPSEQKEVIMLRHFCGMSFKEIADRTGVSINTALGRMRYALINLRKLAETSNVVLLD